MKDENKRKGFTLLEIMFASSLIVLALGMSVGFMVEAVKVNFVSTEKNDINKDLRMVVDRLARDARQANFFLLYESAEDADRNGDNDRRRAGRSGDFLVLIKKVSWPDLLQSDDDTRMPRPIRGITIYYRDPTEIIEGELAGPVRVWRAIYAPDEEVTGTPDAQYQVQDSYITDPADIRNPERLYPTKSELANAAQVIEFSVGLADGRLFYNHNDRSIMVNGKIIHGNVAKRVTDTYNFTISPRG